MRVGADGSSTTGFETCVLYIMAPVVMRTKKKKKSVRVFRSHQYSECVIDGRGEWRKGMIT